MANIVPNVEAADTKEIDMASVSSSKRYNQNSDLNVYHKVGVPSKQNLFREFTNTVKETFFADDPLRHFKHQSRSRKFILGLQAVFPILEWGRGYNLAKFRGDLIAGLTIASLCIPQVCFLLPFLLPFFGIWLLNEAVGCRLV